MKHHMRRAAYTNVSGLSIEWTREKFSDSEKAVRLGVVWCMPYTSRIDVRDQLIVLTGPCRDAVT